jgi:hypothetical protein
MQQGNKVSPRTYKIVPPTRSNACWQALWYSDGVIAGGSLFPLRAYAHHDDPNVAARAAAHASGNAWGDAKPRGRAQHDRVARPRRQGLVETARRCDEAIVSRLAQGRDREKR